MPSKNAARGSTKFYFAINLGIKNYTIHQSSWTQYGSQKIENIDIFQTTKLLSIANHMPIFIYKKTLKPTNQFLVLIGIHSFITKQSILWNQFSFIFITIKRHTFLKILLSAIMKTQQMNTSINKPSNVNVNFGLRFSSSGIVYLKILRILLNFIGGNNAKMMKNSI